MRGRGAFAAGWLVLLAGCAAERSTSPEAPKPAPTATGTATPSPTPPPGEPAYPGCLEASPLGSLGEKAGRFDDQVPLFHSPAGQNLIFATTLDPTLAFAQSYELSDNQGLWTSAYTASQAFRYAATGETEALQNLRRSMRGQLELMQVTGVPGLFARSYVVPGLAGFPSEAELAASYPECDLAVAHCKKWIRVDAGPLAGRWFKNDVSKDEYAGHVFALGVAAELVDDPEVVSMVNEMLSAIAEHLVTHSLKIHDVDGRVTKHGSIHPYTLDDTPSFQSVLALSWIRTAASATGDAALETWYRDCLLHENAGACPDWTVPGFTPYHENLGSIGLNLGCQTNWNNHNMMQLGMYPLLRFETDPEVREGAFEALEGQLWAPEGVQFPMREQANALFTFLRAANPPPGSAPIDSELNDAVCTLQRFPAETWLHATNTDGWTEACKDRLDHPMADVLVPIDRRSMSNYHWTRNPYRIGSVAEDKRDLASPEGFLLAYWMGRYYGWIDPAL